MTILALVWWAFGATPARASVPATVSHNWAGIAEFQYRMFSVAQDDNRAFPSCGSVCDFLWQREQALDPGDDLSQELWREMYILGFNDLLFKGFRDFGNGTTFGSQSVLEEDLLGDTPWRVTDWPQRHVGTVIPSDAGGNYGALTMPHQRIGYNGACGTDGLCYEGEITSPTLGWWTTPQHALSPPSPPSDDFVTLSATHYYNHWVGNDLIVGTDGVLYQYFAPLRFDGPPSDMPRTYDDANRHYYTMVDPGFGVARDKIVEQFTEHTEDYQTLIDWIDTELNDPDFRARQFRPKLMFDKGEKWRPLNVDVYLNERNPVDGQPVQCIGVSRSTCEPSEGLATLRAHHSPNDRIFQGDALTSGTPVSADDYSTTDVTCELDPPGADYALQDCDNGPAATIYYNALTRSSGYNYFDYWFFYRYNEFTADDHEADWEHVTVAQSATDPNTFDWVQFFQHTYSSDYSISEGGLGGNYLRGEPLM